MYRRLVLHGTLFPLHPRLGFEYLGVMGIIDRDERLIALFRRLRQFARYSVGRMTGQVPGTDGRYLFLLDLAEQKRVNRVEINALVRILIDKKFITEGDWSRVVEREFEAELATEKGRFPEVTPSIDGTEFEVDIQAFEARTRRENWPA